MNLTGSGSGNANHPNDRNDEFGDMEDDLQIVEVVPRSSHPTCPNQGRERLIWIGDIVPQEQSSALVTPQRGVKAAAPMTVSDRRKKIRRIADRSFNVALGDQTRKRSLDVPTMRRTATAYRGEAAEIEEID